MRSGSEVKTSTQQGAPTGAVSRSGMGGLLREEETGVGEQEGTVSESLTPHGRGTHRSGPRSRSDVSLEVATGKGRSPGYQGPSIKPLSSGVTVPSLGPCPAPQTPPQRATTGRSTSTTRRPSSRRPPSRSTVTCGSVARSRSRSTTAASGWSRGTRASPGPCATRRRSRRATAPTPPMAPSSVG